MYVALNSRQNTLSWICQLAAAVILGQSLFFKFTGAEESVYIFSALGVEPWGRFATGALELVVVVLLLRPRTAAAGAALGLGVMAGALLAHLTRLGLEVFADGGLLFGLNLTTLLCCGIVAWLRRDAIPLVGNWIAARS
ncbi:MAG TPA: DoxX family protein [Gemmatimonadales bacterium]|nr:DoxX family protein [Gemmatimonadales bacterium]